MALASTLSAQTDLGQRQALARAEAAGRAASTRAAQLEQAAAEATDSADRASKAAVAVAAQVQAAEADIAAVEQRIALIEALRREQRAALAVQQGPTVRLMAALQTMAMRPAALALAEPGSIGQIVRTHAVLAGVRPAIDARTAGLRQEVKRGRQLRAAADAALAQERTTQNRLLDYRKRLAALEARKRIESTRLASGAMIEQDRAVALGEQARDLTDLVASIDDAAAVRARLETLPGPVLRPVVPGAPRALPVETAAAEAPSPAYRLPVLGTVVAGFGEVSDTGVKARGLTIATRPNAQAVAPARGRIAFAAPFRGYGQIVMIDHGLGWTTVVTGLSLVAARVGDTVEQGTPIGRASANMPTVTVELRRRGTPVDIARLAG